MKIYGHVASPRAFRAIWALEEAGVEYELEVVSLSKGEHKSESHRRRNPMEKIPVLEDGDIMLTESGAICYHIAEKFPESRLLPQNPRDRSECHRWVFFSLNELDPLLWRIAMNSFVLPAEQRRQESIQEAARDFERPFRVLKHAIKPGQFIVGNSFSIADIIVATTIGMARRTPVESSDSGIDGYLESLFQRTAFQRASSKG